MGMNVRKMSRENGVETLDRWEVGERVEVRMTVCVVSAVINESKALLTFCQNELSKTPKAKLICYITKPEICIDLFICFYTFVFSFISCTVLFKKEKQLHISYT